MSTDARMKHPTEEQKTDTKMNNVSSNFKGGLQIIKWLCENECDNPWQNICDSDDMQNLPPTTSLICTK